MRGARLRTTILVLALTPALSSCRFFRKSKPAPQPPPRPIQTLPARVETPQPPPQLEPPPQLPPSSEPQQPLPIPEQKAPPPPARRRPSPAGPRVPPATESAPAAPSAPAPQLRPMLTQAQRQELERALSGRILRAQSILAAMAGKNLSRGQSEIAAQIRTFIKQAEEARYTDLLRANNLAERAEVLAQDLAKRVR